MTGLLTTRSRRALVLVLVLLLVAGAVGLRLLTRTEPTRFSAVFSKTVGLYKGSEVKILGLPVGKVLKVTPRGTSVRVDMELDPGQKVAADTGAVIVSPTLVSDRFVQLTKPWTSGRPLATGSEIPKAQTATPVEIDELYQSLDDLVTTLGPKGANADGSLSELIEVGADNLGGNGKKINTMLREFGKATGTLSGSADDFFGTVANFQELNETLVDNDKGVATVNQQFADVTNYLAADRGDLRAALKNLAAALAVLDDFIKDNRTHLKRSVDNLIGPTQTLVRQRKSLEEAIRVLPVALQNFLNTYDESSGTLSGRANLNELTIWSGGSGRSGGRSADDAPPVLLPSLEDQR